jgi:hypothetical protein
MLIYADSDGRKVIQELCDVALKAGGLQNFNRIGTILNSIQPLDQVPGDGTVHPIKSNVPRGILKKLNKKKPRKEKRPSTPTTKNNTAEGS